jgi:tRNA threonylcarbamoyladenosine biosynthesis protein TsaB
LLILAFETSAKACSVALHDGKKLLSESYQNTGLTHSQTLMVMAEDLLKVCGKSAKDVTHLAVAAGPGSFTGVRIGVAAAKGFAWGAELPVYGVSTLDAMARQVKLTGCRICACMDARRNQVYNAIFSTLGDTWRKCEDRAISIEELKTDLQKDNTVTYLVGDGAELVYKTLAEEVDNLVLLPEQWRQQRASGVAEVTLEQIARGESGDGATLNPNYLRLSQAERERMEKENQK